MTPLLPTFFSSSKKKSSPQSASSGGWQKSGPKLKREGERKSGALTSIHNISRGSSSDVRKDSRPVSSIARAKNENSHGDTRRHVGVSTQEESRKADDKRYGHIRRLIKERKIKESRKEKNKNKGLFF